MSSSEEKDKLSVNIFKCMKLIGAETKRWELTNFYKKARDVYDEVYREWRELQKSYIEYEFLQKGQQNASGPLHSNQQRSIVDIWSATAKLGTKSPIRMFGMKKHPSIEILEIDKIEKSKNQAFVTQNEPGSGMNKK